MQFKFGVIVVGRSEVQTAPKVHHKLHLNCTILVVQFECNCT